MRCFLIFFIAGIGVCAQESRVVPVNVAEAVFASFWDSSMAELKNWNTEGSVLQSWCFVRFEWPGKKASGPVVKMSRKGPIDCSGYDKFLVSLNLPPGVLLKIYLKTDRNTALSCEWTVESSLKEEYVLDLNGARRIDEICLEIYPDKDNTCQSGWISWMGLRNSKLMEEYKGQWKKFAEQPLDVFLAPSGTSPSFTSRFGLVVNTAELERIRKKIAELSNQEASDYFPISKNIKPETYMREFMPIANPKIFARTADYGIDLPRLRSLAESGIVRKDADALRLAAETAVAIAICPNWDAGFTIFFPGSAFDQRPFAQTVIAYELAVTLDLAWDMFSSAGRELIMRRLALDGVGFINYNAWKYPYIFDCNQLAAFSKGRIASYMAMEKQNWSHVSPYSDLAYRELCESINNIILADGGFAEGTAYLQYTLASAVSAFVAYAGARDLNLKSIVPENLVKTGAYADAFISTDRRGGLVPFSSGQGEGRAGSLEAIAFMASLCQDSQWVTLFRNMTKDRMPPDNLIIWSLVEKIPKKIPEAKAFVMLPEMCVMASTRKYNDETVKFILFGGRKEFSGHQHEDRGSFVLEFGGDTYAMDPGGKSYSESGAEEIKHCQFHNMLIPSGLSERPHAVIPSPEDIRPDGNGDEKTFNASINPEPAWSAYYKKWIRSISSPSPDLFFISDDYELIKGDGVDFVWMTQLPVKIDESYHTITLNGENTFAVIKVPETAHVKVEKLPLREGKMNKISIHIEGIKNKIEISVKLGLGMSN